MMKVGLNLYSIRNLIATEEDFLVTAHKLREMGYDYLQYSGGEYDPARIKRVSEAAGLPVYLTHVPMDRILNDTDALMAEHESFGCHNIGLGAMPRDILVDDERFKQTVAALDAAAEKMAQKGFRFFYHHHHFEFMKRNGETLFDYMVKNAPHVNFTVDTYWLQYAGVDILATLEKVKGRIGCTHLKDYAIEYVETDDKKEFKPVFAPVGNGNIDFAPILQKMHECGAEYYFVEQDNAAKLPDPLGEVEQSVRYVKNHL